MTDAMALVIAGACIGLLVVPLWPRWAEPVLPPPKASTGDQPTPSDPTLNGFGQLTLAPRRRLISASSIVHIRRDYLRSASQISGENHDLT
jgi:hypothetical protein